MMDNSGISSSSLLRRSSAGVFDLDPSIHHQYQSNHLADHLHPPLVPCASGGVEDDDSAGNEENRVGSGDKAKQGSPWLRMKWTDEVVRLMIAVVAFVNDEGTPDPVEAAARRRSGAVLQKKGKWKAVSKLMMEKGCRISPQQCEDKFNDLNKRYKRLNEILGRGTTCMVVENPSLLDSMTHVSAKMKEDVKRIFNSKHLFYREMCAYHNGQKIPGLLEMRGENLPNLGSLQEGTDNDDDDDDDDGGNDDDEKSEDEIGGMGFNNFHAEIDLVFHDQTKTASEKLEWFQGRELQLKQEKLAILAEGFELEKRSFKWQRFRNKKDREMEKMRLENERLMLESERMILEVKRKELEL
ncbi:hypothetical protein AXF42_Ash017253 [Apostasia shenzhenica]|uniref:Myb/SANT-like DNA-binding domain-containing protein n=1 Tax=Apostasia shenzhenica TaxID=1088818 RepID=A0A2H9ZVJ9_9ASPA|nr:hypothetical protein AXF42_Ash017253 [Apostasia shenzhenica]